MFFDTSEALTADDTDTRVDIYEHVVGGGTNLVSTGPQGGNGAFDASFENTNPDGSHVLFRTAEQLVAADTDAVEDVYDRSGGTTTLVSTGPQATTCFFGPSTAYSYAISPDGTRILFTSSDKLVPEDVDCGGDVYERAGGTTTLVSKGSQTQASGSFDQAGPAGFSSDLTTVYFSSEARLEPEDTDSSSDIYKREGGVTTLVSVGPNGGNGAFGASNASYGLVDGTTFYFTTSESLVSADTDTSQDIYARDGTTTTLVSAGPAGGNGAFTHTLYRTTPDGSHALFVTDEALVAGDTDTRQDLYEYTGGACDSCRPGRREATAPSTSTPRRSTSRRTATRSSS